MSFRTLSCVALCAFSICASAAPDVRPFVAGSLGRIDTDQKASTHCPQELRALGELKKRQPGLDIVLVAADSTEEAAQGAELATRFGLGRVEQWVFADEMPERLRFEIDPRWHGELPRTHFYDRAHRVEAVSGVVPARRLGAWVAANVR